MREKIPTLIRRDFFTGPLVLCPPLAIPWLKFAKRAKKHHRIFCRLFSLAPGSRENFYHFLIGYLLPVVQAQGSHRFPEFRVVDCGPLMTPILRETLQRLGHRFEIVPATQVENPIWVESWDRFNHFTDVPKLLPETADLVRKCWSEYECPASDCEFTENLIIRRSEPHEYYLRGMSEFKGHGTSRRGISNLGKISASLENRGVPHTLFDAGLHCLGCQIRAFTGAKRILGMRGADWANVIWAGKNLRVLMYDSMPPAKVLSACFQHLGIDARIEAVPQRHVELDFPSVLEFFTEA